MFQCTRSSVITPKAASPNVRKVSIVRIWSLLIRFTGSIWYPLLDFKSTPLPALLYTLRMGKKIKSKFLNPASDARYGSLLFAVQILHACISISNCN